MSVKIEVFDKTPELFNRIKRIMSTESMNKIAGQYATNEVVKHFAEIEQDSEHHKHEQTIGGDRTHFYEQAGQQTSFTADDAAAIVTVSKIGISQRYYGGPITPISGIYLTIPARGEAYGHRALEFDLRFVKISEELAALFPRESKRGDGEKPYYWLVKGVNQEGDKTILPDEDKLREAVTSALSQYFQEGFSE